MLEKPRGMTNFVVIHPHKDREEIKKLYSSLGLVDIDTNIVFVVDGLEEKEVNEFVEFVNTNIEYSCLMNTCEEKEIQENISYMSGMDGDKLYTIKAGKIEESSYTA